MNSAVTCSVIFFILGDNMKALIKRNKKNIIIGVLIVVFLPVLLFVSGKIYHKIRDNHLYGDIYDLAEKNGLSICYIDPDSVKGVEIYFTNNARRPQVMQSLYNFSKELEEYLNNNKELFSSDEEIRAVCLTFGGVEKQISTHYTVANCSPSDNEYIFNTYYCYFETGFEGISYIKNVKELNLMEGTISDLKGIEYFSELKSLYADIADDKKEELAQKLPDCKIRYR